MSRITIPVLGDGQFILVVWLLTDVSLYWGGCGGNPATNGAL